MKFEDFLMGGGMGTHVCLRDYRNQEPQSLSAGAS